MSELRLDYIAEPKLVFGSGQQLESPKDGLFLFGPERIIKENATLRIGVIGTKAGITFFNEWVSRVKGFVQGKESSSAQHRSFLGFSAVYGVGLADSAVCELIVTDEEIDKALMVSDRHIAIFRTVDVFSDPIKRYIDEERRSSMCGSLSFRNGSSCMADRNRLYPSPCAWTPTRTWTRNKPGNSSPSLPYSPRTMKRPSHTCTKSTFTTN